MNPQFSPVNPARIMVVDDHPFVREGIVLLINREADLNVCCESGNINDVLAINKQCRHDLLILDLSLGEIYSYDLIKQLRIEVPYLLILVMSMHEESVYAERALKVGAHGYVMKQAATDTLLHAAREVLAGELYVSNRMRTRILSQLVEGSNPVSNANGLSSTEIQVLQLIGKGMGNPEIAAILNRSVKTVEAHRSNIRRKLNLYSARDLTKFAIQWINSEPFR